MKILFCTDGSDISLYAAENAASFFPNADADVICVVDWSFLPASLTIDDSNYSKAYESIAESVLNYASVELEKMGLKVTKKIKSFGSAAEGIIEQLEEEDYDLIVLGSHGKKGLQKWLGSVSRQVVTHTVIPAFISRKKMNNKKILLTVDGSEHAHNAVKEFAELINLQDKEIYVISVKESPELLPLEAAMDQNWLDDIEKQQRIHAAKAVNKAKMVLEEKGIKIHSEAILTGNAAEKIIEVAKNEEIDLVVMGARSKMNLSLLLLGSVSKRVLEHVDSSIMIVRA